MGSITRREALFTLLVNALVATTAVAQDGGKSIEHQQQIWYGYFGTAAFNERWSVIADVQERHFIDPLAQHQFLVRANLARAIGSGWSAGPGMSLFLQWPQDPTSTSELVVPELRPYLEFNGRQKNARTRISHRFKIEFRFFQNVEGEELAPGYSFGNFRFRYRFGVDVPLIRSDAGEERLALRVNDELHVNAGAHVTYNMFDQNRLYVGLQLPLRASLALEAGYLWWFQQRASGSAFYSRDVLRFAVQHTIDLRPRQAPSEQP